MKRLTILLFVLLVALLSIFLIKKKNTDTSTEQVREQMKFHVDDIDKVYKIFISERNEKPVLLTRAEKGWMMDGKYPVNRFVMDGILDVLEHVRVRYIPSSSEVDSHIPILSAKGIKVEVYDEADNNLLTYYIGGVTQTEKGTHFYKEGGDRSYVMEMPYGEVNIRQRFSINYDDWKTRLIFKDKVEEIKSVHVNYPRSPSHGFYLKHDEGKYSIRPSREDQPIITRPLRDDVFEKYLVNFKGVHYVSYLNKATIRDSIVAQTPFMETQLVNTKNDTFGLVLWPKNRPLSSPMQAQNPNESIAGYFALNSHGDFGSVQPHIVRGIIASYAGFFK